MAEAFLRKYAGNQFEVFSAGLDPKGIHPYTIKVMEELGYTLKGHTSKNLSQYLGKIHFGILITVCAKAEKSCPIFPGPSTRFFWPFDDPAAVQGTDEEKLAKFRQVRDQIHLKIRDWLKERNLPAD
jgi:arsenate reductase